MEETKYFLFVFLIFGNFLIETVKCIENDDNPYRHVHFLDSGKKYRLEWVVKWEEERIVFNITVKTHGWVGFGIGKEARMRGADMVIAGVNSKTGKPYFTDRFAIGNEVPIVDKRQDWELHDAFENYGETHLIFSRKMDTCDEKEDVAINDDSIVILWAFGETDNPNEYHLGNRGALPMHLRDPDLTPRIIQEKLRNGQVDGPVLSDDEDVWRIRTNFRIPPKRTTYWCRILKLSLGGRKHHIIGYTATINNQTQLNMHHMLIYRCSIPDAAEVFEKFVDHPGEECYSQSQQLGVIPFRHCTEMKIGYAIGGRPVFFPDEMGIPIGGDAPDEYYLFQTHYDNPGNRTDLVSVNELDIYYTSTLRPNDGGMISQGHNLPGTPSILVPPFSQDHKIFGHCSPFCTRKLLPPHGIKLVGALLHTHNAGRKLTLHHFRENLELPHLVNDDNYIATFQPVRFLREERRIMPGDQVTMRCHYDTTYTDKTTIGGWGADFEMCKSFIFYYSLLESFTCRSEIVDPEYVARYFAGTRNYTWDQSQLELVATNPPHLAGMTLTDISDSPDLVRWDFGLRTMLQKDHVFHPQIDFCPTEEETKALIRGEPPRGPPTLVSYPVQLMPYQPPKQCSAVGINGWYPNQAGQNFY